MIENKPKAFTQEVDLIAIFNILKTFWIKILFCGFLAGAIGAASSFLIQKEFVSQAKLLPEISAGSSSKLSGGLGALAGLAGIDLGSVNSLDAVRPDLYPNIIQSTPFALHILKQKAYVSEFSKIMPLEDYLKAKQKSWFSSNTKQPQRKLLDPQNLSKSLELDAYEDALVKTIFARISASFDRKTSIITISVKMPDPVLAANIANLTLEYLKNYVTNYRTEKAKIDLSFVEKQVSVAKKRYQNAETALANFQDKNRFLILQTAKIQESRLNSEFSTAQSIYNDLNRQYEQAKIKVQEVTPVFNVYEPPRIPLIRSEPKRRTFFSVFFAIGAMCAVIFIFFKNRKLIN
ncbi:Wzz/FepE/Etk N-terminal domain-containing protein [Runella sp. MFBS21]|uniref:Wzz/FepE/Etk N-terminal domain-containing protein n=1 Tax=Runella sp. MFBS21 TaxID=3034018 RepID=UPI0023F77F17|nr:Wzz/FepE/Etk N-terminal domain-containing protein [Runella sp. MFBS21]MDF7820165.1 Wzz/FepE/Etk N-terminal domain-containing protein [Runella sp. MFBS21]